MWLFEYFIYFVYVWICVFMSFSEFFFVDNGLLVVVVWGNLYDILNNDLDYLLGLWLGWYLFINVMWFVLGFL